MAKKEAIESTVRMSRKDRQQFQGIKDSALELLDTTHKRTCTKCYNLLKCMVQKMIKEEVTIRNHHKELWENQHLEIKHKQGEDGVSVNEWGIRTEQDGKLEERLKTLPRVLYRKKKRTV